MQEIRSLPIQTRLFAHICCFTDDATGTNFKEQDRESISETEQKK